MNILIVDDDPIITHLLPAFCTIYSKECMPLTARNGEEALRIVASERIDLILTDVEMPVMDGCELVARVKEQYPTMRIVVMTGLRCDEVDRRLRAAGISQYIEKPFTVRDFAMCIESALNNGYGKPLFGGDSCFL
jgi:two-component system, response regulator YesN